jgi:hypothetical protein
MLSTAVEDLSHVMGGTDTSQELVLKRNCIGQLEEKELSKLTVRDWLRWLLVADRSRKARNHFALWCLIYLSFRRGCEVTLR